MPVTVDDQPFPFVLPPGATLATALDAARDFVAPAKRVIVGVEVAGQLLSGAALDAAQSQPLGHQSLAFSSRPQVELAESMIGKLAALIEYLAGQHVHVAQLIEQGKTAEAMEKLSTVLGAWQQIQHAFSSTVRLLKIDLDIMPVNHQPASLVIAEFHRQLTDIAEALKAHDMVLLGDILQYEMDSATHHWAALLESTLAVAQAV